MTNKLDGLSLDLEGTNKDKLKSVFPECFTEGTLDIVSAGRKPPFWAGRKKPIPAG